MSLVQSQFLHFKPINIYIKKLLTARYLSVVFFCTIKGFVEFRLVQKDYISEILPKREQSNQSGAQLHTKETMAFT